LINQQTISTIQAELNDLIEHHGWLDIPRTTISREGYAFATGNDEWVLHAPSGVKAIAFDFVEHPFLKWALQRYILHCVQYISSVEGYNSARRIRSCIFSKLKERQPIGNSNIDDIRDLLIVCMQDFIREAREDHVLWGAYRPVRWYVWCADNYPELGFCPQYANEIDGMSIPGNPKGEAVRSEDPDAGPLDRILEMPLLRRALEMDQSEDWAHLQEKAALALAIGFGRNPTNLVWLNEKDLSAEFEEIPGLEPFYTVKIPRIKKRLRHPRSDLKTEPLDKLLAKHLQNLITANQGLETIVETTEGDVTVERPLFFRRARTSNRGRASRERVYAPEVADIVLRMDSGQMTQLLRDFVARHNLISPITGELMWLNTRRLRYTLATGLVEEGISRRELAEILDHSDTQSVEVYFELKGQIVKHLDAAALPKLAGLIGFFKGRVVSGSDDAINGDRPEKYLHWFDENKPEDGLEIGVCGESEICNLDPPFSCYLCPKFQPYQEADHEHVLDQLINSRSERLEKYENSRLGLQLDDVIAAVSSAIKACRDKSEQNV
jgi:hypothetical protein